MNRMNMVFINSGYVPRQPVTNFNSNLASIGAKPTPRAPSSLPLNAPMVDRIHKAKPGCSACGKKVA